MSRFRSKIALAGIVCQLLWAFTATPLVALAAPQNFDSLVAPIALYPDSLLGQVLAASTSLTQVSDADEWVNEHPDLKGDALTNAVAKKKWDPSVKALAHFPSVLSRMSSNQGWSSALGAAYTRDPEGVMKAIQSLRHRAKDAGQLSTNQEVKVVENRQSIIIQPQSPQTIYVPQYNPTVVYGHPVAAYPGYSGADLALTGALSYGAGIATGALLWGRGGGWGMNWGRNGGVVNNNNNNINTSGHNPDSSNNKEETAGDETEAGDNSEHSSEHEHQAAEHEEHGDEHEAGGMHGDLQEHSGGDAAHTHGGGDHEQGGGDD